MNIAVLYGGDSTEREVSVRSGEQCAIALRQLGHSADLIDTIDKNYIEKLSSMNYDVVFMALHGGTGESGFVQAVCEELKIPYTHSGSKASAIAMDKRITKLCYESEGVKTPRYYGGLLSDFLKYDEMCEYLKTEKMVIKPACGGSSVGVFIVDNKEKYENAISEIAELDRYGIVEEFISGIEVSVPYMAMSDGEEVVFPTVEVKAMREFYSYEAKYAPGGCLHICPANIETNIEQKCRDLAKAAYKAIGCSGIARTDMLIDADGEVWVLETNTIPGMRPDSLVADSAKVMGMKFVDLIDMMLHDARLKGY